MKNLIVKLTAVILTIMLMSFGSNESSNKNKINLTLSSKEYIDPKGYFSIFPPENWTIKEFPDDTRGKVHFIKSENIHLMILVKSISQKSFDDFYTFCQTEGKEKLNAAGAKNLTIDRSKYGEYNVIIRRFSIQGSRSLMVDYLLDGMNHNLYYSAPSNEFDSYIKIIEASISTYNPYSKIITSEEKNYHAVQSRRRVAKLLFDMGEYEQARMFVEDGFKISPNDTVLLEIEKNITDKERESPNVLETEIITSDSTNKDLQSANSKNEDVEKNSNEGEGIPLLYMILTLAGAIIITFSKKIADGTAWPGLARISAPIIGAIMMFQGFNLLFSNGHIFLGIITILLAIIIFVSPLVFKNMIKKK